MGKSENYGFFENDCSLRPDKKAVLACTNNLCFEQNKKIKMLN